MVAIASAKAMHAKQILRLDCRRLSFARCKLSLSCCRRSLDSRRLSSAIRRYSSARCLRSSSSSRSSRSLSVEVKRFSFPISFTSFRGGVLWLYFTLQKWSCKCFSLHFCSFVGISKTEIANLVNIDKIKTLAKSQGIKLNYLAAQIGVPHTYFADIKNKNRDIPDSRLAVIAELLSTLRTTCGISRIAPILPPRLPNCKT